MRGAALSIATLLCFSLSAPGAQPEHRGHHWLRRITWAASCAASFWDVETTHVAVSQGAAEGNGFFAGPNGRPRWGRIIGFKAGVCVSSFFAESRFARSGTADWFFTGANAASTAVFLGAGIHNLRLAGELKKQNEASSSPAN